MITIGEERQEELLQGNLGTNVSRSLDNWQAFNAGFTAGINATIEESHLRPPFEASDGMRRRLSLKSWSLKWPQYQGASLETIFRIAFLDAIRLTLEEINKRRRTAA